MNIYTISSAAKYLGLSIVTVKHHVYKSKRLTPVLMGKVLIFTQEDLDNFKSQNIHAGRPRTK